MKIAQGVRPSSTVRIDRVYVLDDGMILLTIDILAVHDPCLAQMQFEAALTESFVNSP